jgi:thiamine pyrophosphate-dependent acetolactate synthase large subunit-like protein
VSAALDRRAVVAALLADRDELLVVSGLGSATYDVAACGDHPLNLYQWGGMGGTAMIGLGLALAQPSRRVVVITGDGDMLMGLGSLATIGVRQPANLSIVVLDNGHYGETGMQASHTSHGVDLPRIATACGFPHAHTVRSLEELTAVRIALHHGSGPQLFCVQISTAHVPRVLPTRDGHALRVRFSKALGG